MQITVNTDKIREAVSGRRFRRAILVSGAILALLLTFQAGLWVGGKKTEHAYRWSDNYGNNFAPLPDPAGGRMLIAGGPEGGLGGHGVSGTVIMTDGRRLTIEDRHHTERAVYADARATVRRCSQAIGFRDIAVGEWVTAIGAPDGQGQTRAMFIRVMPSSGCRTFFLK